MPLSVQTSERIFKVSLQLTRKEKSSMITKITTKQSKQINALIKRLCCNCEDGNCLLLDDGDEHSCVQLISKSGIFCNYFKKGVLPADNQLYTEIMSKEKGKKIYSL